MSIFDPITSRWTIPFFYHVSTTSRSLVFIVKNAAENFQCCKMSCAKVYSYSYHAACNPAKSTLKLVPELWPNADTAKKLFGRKLSCNTYVGPISHLVMSRDRAGPRKLLATIEGLLRSS